MKVKDKLKLLRKEMEKEGIDVYYFNTSDYHQSEYAAEYFRTILYFSGFTGSLATLLVDKEKAYIFVDGRYHIQADKQAGINGIEVIKLGLKDNLHPLDFIHKYYKGKVIGLDGRRTSARFAQELLKDRFKIKSIDIYSSLIEDRVPLSVSPIYELELKYTGMSRKDKLARVLKYLKGRTLIVNNLESIAYETNFRSDDVKCTPVFYSYLIFDDNQVHLFINKDRLSNKNKKDLKEDGILLHDYDEYYEYLKTINNKDIELDLSNVNYETLRLIEDNNNLINTRSVIEYHKSSKNETEIANSRIAHELDGVAMVKFLKWFDESNKSKLNEYDVGEKLNQFRYDMGAFDLSFNPIVAYEANAAMMHYSATKDNFTKLNNKGILLIDSGGQYKEGTTDITRTIYCGDVGDEFKKHFSLVLKSMFNLSEAVFLNGMSGYQLDILARKDLWEIGIDYLCGTGHGVGHVLSVHEGPPNIRFRMTESGSERVPIVPGNIFSDEPGVYLEGKYGIRCENMVLCKKAFKNEYGQFLKLETLTLCPFDTRLIDKKYLDEKTINLLNNYHKNVYKRLAKYLNDDEKEYLKKVTEKI